MKSVKFLLVSTTTSFSSIGGKDESERSSDSSESKSGKSPSSESESNESTFSPIVEDVWSRTGSSRKLRSSSSSKLTSRSEAEAGEGTRLK